MYLRILNSFRVETTAGGKRLRCVGLGCNLIYWRHSASQVRVTAKPRGAVRRLAPRSLSVPRRPPSMLLLLK